ncbi:HSF1 protein, partial [Centropus bengalensis]|nr:HSF1 protein [Centropus bengalensis]
SSETPLFPTTFIDSILQENDPNGNSAPAEDGSARPPPQEKCLSVACLDKNELNDHLDTIDSNLDNLQTMLTTHGFSVDTSALLDIQDLISSQEQQKLAETEAGTTDTGTGW